MAKFALAAACCRQSSVQSGNLTYYEILGVRKNATQQEIKKAYYEKSKQIHPDRGQCSSQEEIKRRNDAFSELCAAYDVLKAPERRHCYDISLSKRTYAPLPKEWSNPDIFGDFEHRNKEKRSDLFGMYDEFWMKFGIFGSYLRFLTKSLVIATFVVTTFIYFAR